MANANEARRLQRSIRPLRSEYRIFKDSDTGRTIYVPHNELDGWDFVEFGCNVSTCFLWALLACRLSTTVNSNWLLFGAIWVGCCFWQNESVTRWPLRFLTWALFWGAITLST